MKVLIQKSSVYLFLMLCFSFLNGFSGGCGGTTVPVPPVGGSEGCKSDADCDKGEVCVQSKAQPIRIKCATTEPGTKCGGGQELPNPTPTKSYCVKEPKKPEINKCKSDLDCREGEFCNKATYHIMVCRTDGKSRKCIKPPPAEEGICEKKRPETKKCSSNSDCGKGEECVFSAKTQPAKRCGSDSSDRKSKCFVAPDVAQEGICQQKRPEKKECFSDKDCGSKQYCAGLIREEHAEPKNSKRKPEGTSSDAGSSDAGSSDAGSGDASSDRAPTIRIKPGVCLDKKPEKPEVPEGKECKKDEDCGDGNTCVRAKSKCGGYAEVGTCQKGKIGKTTQPIRMATCLSDADCKEGLICKEFKTNCGSVNYMCAEK